MPQDEELLTEDQLEEQESEQSEQEESQSHSQGEEDSHSASEADVNRGRKPFLQVDERTTYATREDAVKGYAEAGKRIAALSAWEKELKEYGELSPSDVRAYLDELIETRQSASDLRAELEKFKKEREEDTRNRETETRVSGESKLTKEEREAVDWLKEKLPSLGYISKEDAMKLIGELQAKTGRIDQIEETLRANEERTRQTLIADSQAKLKTQMKSDGYMDDEEGSLQILVENSIRAWIDGDPTGRRAARFYAGGTIKDALIQEGYEKAKKALGLLKSTTTSTYAGNKAAALKRNAQAKLPTGGAGSGKPLVKRGEKRVNSSGKRDYIGEKHNEAWEVASRYFSNNEEQ